MSQRERHLNALERSHFVKQTPMIHRPDIRSRYPTARKSCTKRKITVETESERAGVSFVGKLYGGVLFAAGRLNLPLISCFIDCELRGNVN